DRHLVNWKVLVVQKPHRVLDLGHRRVDADHRMLRHNEPPLVGSRQGGQTSRRGIATNVPERANPIPRGFGGAKPRESCMEKMLRWSRLCPPGWKSTCQIPHESWPQRGKRTTNSAPVPGPAL